MNYITNGNELIYREDVVSRGDIECGTNHSNITYIDNVFTA